MESIKINKLEIENTKRVRAVKLTPSANGLTIIGGKNNQGKTSVLDCIAWALGGEKYRPSKPQRDGSVIPPYLHVVLSNGLVVERKGKNSDLKVTDPNGQKAGQQLLNSFVEQLALDLPKFMEASSKKKAETLLAIIGVGEELRELEQREKTLYSDRQALGRIVDRKQKFAEEMPYYPDAPTEPVSASELIRQQQRILAQNGENQRKRDRAESLKKEVAVLEQEVESMREQLCRKDRELAERRENLQMALQSAEDLRDESTAELEQNIENIEAINQKVRANLDKDKAEEDARYYAKQYQEMTESIDAIRKKKADLLASAALPLPGLSVQDSELVYMGQKWDNMSGSDRMKVSTAIVRCLNPQCGFVLLDKLEQMDEDNLNEFGAWLEKEGLQAIATRVSTGGECAIIIEDGYVQEAEEAEENDGSAEEAVLLKPWKAGEF